jgi:hypothetical protein
MGLANYNSPANSPAGFNHPLKPTRAPSAGQAALVPVNRQPLAASGLNGHDTFVFRKDSAGLGVPRGTLGKLNSFSGQTVQHGMAQTNVYYSGARGGGEGQHGSTGEASSAISASQRGPSSMSNMPSASASSGAHGSASAPSGGGHH